MSPVIARCALKGKVTPDSYLCMCVCIHLSVYTHINEVSRHHMTIVCVEDASGERRASPKERDVREQAGLGGGVWLARSMAWAAGSPVQRLWHTSRER